MIIDCVFNTKTIMFLNLEHHIITRVLAVSVALFSLRILLQLGVINEAGINTNGGVL